MLLFSRIWCGICHVNRLSQLRCLEILANEHLLYIPHRSSYSKSGPVAAVQLKPHLYEICHTSCGSAVYCRLGASRLN